MLQAYFGLFGLSIASSRGLLCIMGCGAPCISAPQNPFSLLSVISQLSELFPGSYVVFRELATFDTETSRTEFQDPSLS